MVHRFASAVLVVGLFAAPTLAAAAESTVTLAVHHAGCVLCGPIVKSTLEHVTGVKSVQVSQANSDDDVTAQIATRQQDMSRFAAKEGDSPGRSHHRACIARPWHVARIPVEPAWNVDREYCQALPRFRQGIDPDNEIARSPLERPV